MRLFTPKLLALPFLALFGLSCDQDLNSAGDQPLVDYILTVTDSATALPLDSVRVRVTTIAGDTSTHFIAASDGRLELPSLLSSQTWFRLSRQEYRTLDIIDTVSGPVDTVFNRPKIKLLNIKLARLGADTSNRTQFTLAFRNSDLERLRKGRITFTDSLQLERTVVDEDSNGIVELSGMRIGENQMVRAEHPGYLGRLVPVKIEKLSDSSRIVPGTTLTMLPLASGISGQVNFMTASGAKPLANAGVVFRLKDTLAIPKEFWGLTSSLPGKEGWFEIKDVPGLEGEIGYFKNATTKEHTLLKPLTAEEVLRDGPLAAVTLTIPPDSLSPVVEGLPKDTVNPGDTLVFRFNQPVERLKDPLVRLINAPERILTRAALDDSKRTLKVVQSQDDWVSGKTYSYEIEAVNGQGQGFTRQGDTLIVIRGTFAVRDQPVIDSNLVFPEDIRITGFNSGIDPRFDTSAAESSPKGDSTTRFVRLKWNWKKAGKHVDSLLVFIKDAQEKTSWTQLLGIPGFADSANVDFARLYATVSAKNGKTIFPLRTSATETIQMKVLYIEDGKILDREVVLPSVEQGMGSTVHVRYASTAGLKRGPGARDSIAVTFLSDAKDTNSLVDFGTERPIPKLYSENVLDTSRNHLDWRWESGTKGYLIYSYRDTESPPQFAPFRVDLNGAMHRGKPIWQRNRKAATGLD